MPGQESTDRADITAAHGAKQGDRQLIALGNSHGRRITAHGNDPRMLLAGYAYRPKMAPRARSPHAGLRPPAWAILTDPPSFLTAERRPGKLAGMAMPPLPA